jgi:hypothetical protein
MKPREEWGPADYWALGQLCGPAVAMLIVLAIALVTGIAKVLS